MALSATARPIEGAVATQGVSDRMTFLRKTYAHLGVALIAFAAITAGMLQYATQTSLKFSSWAFTGRWNWMMVKPTPLLAANISLITMRMIPMDSACRAPAVICGLAPRSIRWTSRERGRIR